MILSHMVMRLQKSVPLGAGGYTSVGMADYYSAVSLHNVFFGTAYNETYKKGSKQVESTIFSAITKENDNYAGDPYEPATELRLDALSEGFSMSYPPEGIGGPVYEGLQLLKATSRIPVCNEEFFVTPDIDREDAVRVFAALTEQGILNAGGQLVQAVDTDTDLSYLFTDKQDKVKAYLEQQVRYRLSHALWDIVLRFNLSMPEQTAFVPKSFTLSDGVSIESLSLDGGDDTCIILKAALLRGTVYTVRAARYVKSKNGSTLDPENALVTVGEQEPE